jgi:hypothetical protein
MKKQLKKINVFTFTLLISFFSSVTVYSDDTEIYFSKELTSVDPNILFLLDMSGSMGEVVVGSADPDNPRKITINQRVSTSVDDWEQIRNGSASLYSSDLEMVQESRTQNVAIRFRNVKIPQGVEITKAYLQFQVDERDSRSTNLTISIENSNHAPAYGWNSYNLTNRSFLSQTVSWTPPAWSRVGDEDVDQRTPDITNLIQPIINRSDWNSGNALLFKITGSGKRVAKSYDNDSNAAPLLHIEYNLVQDKTRIQIMQDALQTVLLNAPSKLNVGFMNYGAVKGWDSNYAHGVKFPVSPIDNEARPIIENSLATQTDGTVKWWRSNIPDPAAGVAVRSYLSTLAGAWEPDGYTPIVDAIYEAALYFRGEKVDWGYDEGGKWQDESGINHYWGQRSAHPATYEGDAITWDKHACNTTWEKNLKPGDLSTWLESNDWAVCPYDYTNPASPGSQDNCARTEHDCYDYYPCIDRVGGYCEGDQTDEAGNCLNWISAWCRTRDTNPTRYCKYSICNGELSERPNYTTPITQACQSNFIVLLSDGKPEYSSGTSSQPQTLSWGKLNGSTGLPSVFDKNTCASAPEGYISGRCGPELTHFLAENDNISTLQGDQTVDTYVIGFGLGGEVSAQNYLKSLVTTDNLSTTDAVEGYFAAGDEQELITAFGSILKTIGATTTAFASPGYSVSVKSGLYHDNDIYIPVFDKRVTPLWSGNLKKFKINNGVIGSGDDARSVRKIQGKSSKNGTADTDAVTELGAFTEDAWDLWSTSNVADGRSVEDGGVASRLDADNRKLYSNLNCTLKPRAGGSVCNLTSDTNKINISNVGTSANKITKQLLDVTNNDANWHKTLICFIQGYSKYDAKATPPACGGAQRKHMGDMLHSEPTIVTYDKDYADAGKSNKQVIFTATNEGYLHAFDTKTGTELFAFMPRELFKNIKPQYLNAEAGGHRYGIDGSLSVWLNDADENGVIEKNGADGTAGTADDEFVYLYFGLRRGGKSYYALDVTDPQTPRILWHIDNNLSDFSNMGQTWSTPYLGKVWHNGVKTEAVFFSGGYDTNQDADFDGDNARNATDSEGNDIFIVDAKTGAYIWSIKNGNAGSGISGSSALTHSVPGGVRILDINRDGAIDRMYFGDVAGNLWRVELDADNFDSDQSLNNIADARLIKLASLGGTNPAIDKRKFYNEPDVSIFKEAGITRLMVSIGSGYRAHPVEGGIDDYFYSILDENVNNPVPGGFSTITPANLAAITVNITKDADGNETSTITSALGSQTVIQANKKGWYLDLPKDGEKVLSNSITTHGTIIFTTLVPEAYAVNTRNTDVCGAGVTQGRLYALDVKTAKPVIDLNWSGGDPDDNDLFMVVTANEIPGTVQLIYNAPESSSGGECSTVDCMQNVDIRSGKKLSQVANFNGGRLEPVYWTEPHDD